MNRRHLTVLGILLGLTVAASFWIDWKNTVQGGSVDFRNRMVGARLLEHGIDPYFYHWHQGDPEQYCDPLANPNRVVSRTTVTPTFLLLYLPLGALSYRVEQFLWLILQWLMLLGTGWLWWRAADKPLTRVLIALFVVSFSFVAEWRLHAERGQCYVLLTFAFAGWMTMTLDPRRGNGFLAGYLAGFLVALRPPFLLLVPFLALHRRGQLVGAVWGMVTGFVAPLFFLASCWPRYFSSAKAFAYLYLNQVHVPRVPLHAPALIEGMPASLMSHSLYFPDGLFSFHTYMLRFGLEPIPALPPLLAVGAVFVFWLWWSRQHSAARVLPGIAAWFFLTDLFLPVYRESYNDVLALDILAAGLIVAPRFPWGAWPCLLAIPFGVAVYVLNLDHPWVILPEILYTLGSILFLFDFRSDKLRAPDDSPFLVRPPGVP
jgi:hypothetical protein